MAEIFVTPGEAIEVLREACRLNEGSEPALQARVRQLIEMGVTTLTRDVSRARHRYGLTELAQLAVAISLMKARWQPAAAARLASEAWPSFVPVALAGIGEALPDRFRRLRSAGAGTHAFVEGNGLSELGRKSIRSSRGGGPLPTIRVSDDPSVKPSDGPAPDTTTHIDSSAFMPTIFERVIALAQAPEDIWDSLTRLRQSGQPHD